MRDDDWYKPHPASADVFANRVLDGFVLGLPPVTVY